MLKKEYKKISVTIVKFATSSALATLVDISVFIFILEPLIDIFWAEFISGFIGMIINFILQKKYVFQLKRNIHSAFVLSIAFSFFALLIGSFMMKGLNSISFLASYIIIAKLIVIGFKFFFNFFTKKWIFEKKI